ncbi:SET domain bifurcated histone lysine methyltransferase eggless [Haematobia irritans]|uniref:SET domain bifurcated histone lysine methyltransferase eggless n=1 Tax=Haematobia irritans TaxID=7368 RepID=UPI003F4FC592
MSDTTRAQENTAEKALLEENASAEEKPACSLQTSETETITKSDDPKSNMDSSDTTNNAKTNPDDTMKMEIETHKEPNKGIEDINEVSNTEEDILLSHDNAKSPLNTDSNIESELSLPSDLNKSPLAEPFTEEENSQEIQNPSLDEKEKDSTDLAKKVSESPDLEVPKLPTVPDAVKSPTIVEEELKSSDVGANIKSPVTDEKSLLETNTEENMDTNDIVDAATPSLMEENLDGNSLDKCLPSVVSDSNIIDDADLPDLPPENVDPEEDGHSKDLILTETKTDSDQLPKDEAAASMMLTEDSTISDVPEISQIEDSKVSDSPKKPEGSTIDNTEEIKDSKDLDNCKESMDHVESIEEKLQDTKINESTSIDPEKEAEENIESKVDDMEIMYTCDSQESNLVIDETCDTTENKEANETTSSNKDDDDDSDLAIVEDDVPMVDITDTPKKKKTLTLDGEIVDDVDDTPPNDTKETCEESQNEQQTVENEKKTEDVSKTDSKTDSNETKDDDVIPIEQPPMPVIEIDDEDDDEQPPPTQASKQDSQTSKEGSNQKDDVQPMEIEDEPAAVTSNDDKDQKEGDDLLSVRAEKSMDEIMKESLDNKVEDLTEDENDTTDEVFYNKECINYECPHKHKQFLKVPQFAFSYFKVNKKKFKVQYICAECYDKALDMYEEYCGLINAKQPLLLENIPSGRQEFVEIIDSSDEEDTSDASKALEPSKPSFSKYDLTIIEKELHNTIKSVLDRVEIQNQLTWSKTILTERLKRLESETEFVDVELKSLQKKADKMHEGLYSCPKIKIRQLQPLDLNSGKVMGLDGPHAEVQPIPSVGEIERPPIQIGGTYYAVKNNAIASWVPCKVMEQTDGGSMAQKSVKYYRIKFLKAQHTMMKTVPAKHLAYYDPPSVRLPIGTRVIAYFDATSLARGREKINVQSAFYPGIIAEPLKPNNKYRYLIFYDDGYTQYVYHKDVRLVSFVSENVWEDVHPASRDFIQKYLTQYSINRPMVQTQKGQSMNTESNGYWLHARVVDIDCSLVLMQFEGSKSHTEWIYRGSLRLGPVFKEYQKSLQKNSNLPVSRLSRRTEPFIRYTEDEETSSQQQQQHQQQQSEKANEGNRAVARKTFGRPESMMNSSQPNTTPAAPAVKHLNNSTIYVEDENKPKGKVVYYTAKRNLPPRKYKPHKCSPACLFQITHNLNAYSPLSKPLLSGWERFILRQKIKKVVTYRGPCGKIMRNMKELHHYLRVTKNVLNVDNFDFSHEINCLAEYVIESAIVQKRDISLGQEKMAIPLVNYYDNTLPPECKYSAKVIPTEGVHINTDPEFFAGCDCEDDCSDKSKCSCWQLTLAGAKYGNPNTPPEEVGYQYKRLLEHVPTGIYECNVRCKCKKSCLNRVVQHSLQIKLQVFKTSNRGWGLRCINDVPRGSFVCVYAGHLLTEAKANEGGQDAGDEYFAELDYIEVAEQIKEGYESEVEPPEPEEEEAYQPELDDEFTPGRSFLTRSKKNSVGKTSRMDEDSQERQVINFNPNADMNEESVRENSIRKLYGKDEACYVMDAKISGNLGRYFNHSCAPNMFVQNVFVDTHDLRFPWVAFFASCNIRAGTELTWNYNYEVGVVPGKVLYCQCGAANCRLRLL